MGKGKKGWQASGKVKAGGTEAAEGFALHHCTLPCSLSPPLALAIPNLIPPFPGQRSLLLAGDVIQACSKALAAIRAQHWRGLTRRPSFSCPLSRLSRGKETMLFRFCTCEEQRRGHPIGSPSQGR